MMKTSLTHLPMMHLVILALILSACNAPFKAFTPTETETQIVPPTLTRAPVTATKNIPPPQQSTPKVTKLNLRSPTPTVALPPGVTIVQHPEIPDYVFAINTDDWESDIQAGSQNAFLKNKNIEGCEIRIAPPVPLPLPERYYSRPIGSHQWMVYEYPASAFFKLENIVLDLRGYKISLKCYHEMIGVLSGMLPAALIRGEPTAEPSATPTPRPTMANWFCPGTPPTRLRVGDHVSIVAEGIWLRSEPRAADETKIAQYLKYAPYDIVITGGPACETYTYWKVTMSEMVEGGKVVSGWLAEGDLKDYYLEQYESDK